MFGPNLVGPNADRSPSIISLARALLRDVLVNISPELPQEFQYLLRVSVLAHVVEQLSHLESLLLQILRKLKFHSDVSLSQNSL